MGCTSGKQIKKKTTSVEDVTQNSTPNKNGQITKSSKKEKEPLETAIQIPGTNKSFLAPDGIPFIDEDVEDVEGMEGGTTVVGNATRTPDQNKDVIKVTTSQSQSSALESGSKKGTKEGQILVGDQPQIISDILHEEKRQTVSVQSGGVTTTTTTVSTSNGAICDEEVAATKIQAGIRGFLGRKKVKAIRENQQSPSTTNTVNHMGDGRDVITDKHVEISFPEDDEKRNLAATKIQANYKGYKTRKELKYKQ